MTARHDRMQGAVGQKGDDRVSRIHVAGGSDHASVVGLRERIPALKDPARINRVELAYLAVEPSREPPHACGHRPMQSLMRCLDPAPHGIDPDASGGPAQARAARLEFPARVAQMH